MAILIKNIIIYDIWRNVCGFVELCTDGVSTVVKIRHSRNERNLLLSLTAAQDRHFVFPLEKKHSVFEIKENIDLNKEVMACVMQKDDTEMKTVASGVINLDTDGTKLENSDLDALAGQFTVSLDEKNEKVTPLRAIIDQTEILPINRKTAENTGDTMRRAKAVKEIDKILRAVCTVDDDGCGLCQQCPYREFFYGEGLDSGDKKGGLSGGKSVAL